MITEERKREEEKKVETFRLEVARGGVRSRTRAEEQDDLTSEEMTDLRGG